MKVTDADLQRVLKEHSKVDGWVPCEERYNEILTDEEKGFAEKNIGILNRYKESEYYGVAAIAYLEAVKKWFRKPEVRKWKIQTIAYNAIRYAVMEEKVKEKKNVSAVYSLDDKLFDDNERTYGDCVTNEHTQFVNYISAEDDYMKVSYDVDAPGRPKQQQLCKENLLIADFLRRKEKNMCFEYDTQKEAKTKGHTIREFIRRKRLTTVRCSVIDKCIYIIRN